MRPRGVGGAAAVVARWMSAVPRLRGRDRGAGVVTSMRSWLWGVRKGVGVSVENGVRDIAMALIKG